MILHHPCLLHRTCLRIVHPWFQACNIIIYDSSDHIRYFQTAVAFFQIIQITVVLLNILIRFKYFLSPFSHHFFDVVCNYSFVFVFQFLILRLCNNYRFRHYSIIQEGISSIWFVRQFLDFSTNHRIFFGRFYVIFKAFPMVFVCFDFL
mgnify:CR=1 FL=1